jgi:hypothetical protein
MYGQVGTARETVSPLDVGTKFATDVGHLRAFGSRSMPDLRFAFAVSHYGHFQHGSQP